MKRRRPVPTDQEVHEAVLRHIEEMSREDWSQSIAELSHAPEGVEDPWPPSDTLGSNGSTPPRASRPRRPKEKRP
jgi:hypothetical protein